jgi:ribosomal-protein-alanine N-acetyltransferase
MPRLVPPVVEPGTMARETQPVLSNGSVILRPWTHGDAEAISEAFREPSIQRWHMRQIESESEAIAWIDGWGEGWRSEREASWAVSTDRNNDDGVCGYVALRGIDLEFGLAQITYWVLPGSRGHGVATSSCLAVLDWAFTELGLHRLGLNHSTVNVISCRVASKAGFEHEGTLRSALRHLDGWHDMHAHGRVNGSH